MPTTNPKDKIANHNTALVSLLDEDTINLDLHTVEVLIAEEQVEKCEDHIFLDSQPLDGTTVIYPIKRMAFVDLFNEAKSLPVLGNFVTGLKIYLGYDGRAGIKSQVLIYTPLRFHDGERVGTTNIFVYRQTSEGGSYIYNEGTGKFNSINNTTKNTLISGYKANLELLRTDEEGDIPTAFIEGLDVESVTFSFQEIFAIMYDNRLVGNVNQDIFSGLENKPLRVFNCIKLNEDSGNLQHSLLFASESVDEKLVSFRGKFANLAHLCPPHCSSIKYSLD